jgi:hypothetical protein
MTNQNSSILFTKLAGTKKLQQQIEQNFGRNKIRKLEERMAFK